MYKTLDNKTLKKLSQKKETMVFLDSAISGGKENSSYVFIDPIKTITAKKYEEIEPFLCQLDEYSKKYWLCGYIAYEAAYSFEDNFSAARNLKKTGTMPLAWFGVFKKPYLKSSRPLAVEKEDSKNDDLPVKLSHSLDRDNYYRKVSQIKKYIAQGDTYQVNFTYDVDLSSNMSAFDLYLNLRKQQLTPYCAYLKNEFGNVLSFSPELFFSKNKNSIITKPMKGTGARGYSSKVDMMNREALRNDNKNKAENLMIVDLLRNDLGRVCKKGSVKVKQLFNVETYPTLHQMTSTVYGELNPKTAVSDIVKNIFPCGSVTGAPKIKTMEIISELEEGLRGVYCGMLGYSSPNGKAVFNVSIRTLVRPKGSKTWKYRVGSGIVWNSNAIAEREECITKTSFLITPYPDNFKIFESLLWNGKILTDFKSHVQRLKLSAKYFGFEFSEKELNNHIKNLANKIDERLYKVRTFLEQSGKITLDWSLINTEQTAALPEVYLSNKPVDEKNVFLYHKTTYRPWYYKVSQESGPVCFDVIFRNLKGQITEGSRSNIFIKKNGSLYTPPVKCGLLPGILREKLLKQGNCIEKVLYEKDLIEADEVFCGNSVRGLIKVKLRKNI